MPDKNVDEHQTRLVPHTDFGTITILKDDGNEGLELQMDPKNQGEWTPVRIPEDCICVNLGDALELITNYRWRSTMHRVTLPKDKTKERKSIGYFEHLNPSSTVKALPQEISADRPDHGIVFNPIEHWIKRMEEHY